MSYRLASRLSRPIVRCNGAARRSLSNDERQIGDYPLVAPVSAQLRDPFKYWDKQDRRNQNEPVRPFRKDFFLVCFSSFFLPERNALFAHRHEEVVGTWIGSCQR
jgi:hypothetical protein